MKKTIYTAFIIGLWCFVSFAQTTNGILKVFPTQLEFKSKFSRITDVQFINIGTEPLTITNITYIKPELYFIRFDQYGNYPFTLAPNDTVHMDCILSGYYFVSQQDSSDTMYVFNNGATATQKIKIKIDFFESNLGLGSINGNIKETKTGLPIPNANIHFLLGGNYFINSVFSDNFGNYSAQVPVGDYIVAAEKDSFYTTFYGEKFDPFTTTAVHVAKDSLSNANIDLSKMVSTSYSLSGSIIDNKSKARLSRAVVIIRQGTHTPGKIILPKPQDTLPGQSYTVFADAAGNYNFKNIPQTGYYFIQSFSDFYIPAYFSQAGPSPVFWQQTDSLQINTALTNKNISMQRDSSTGAGIISGIINTGSTIPDKKVVVYAKSLDYNQPFTYSIPIQGNTFTVYNLPYGHFQLVGQLIGFSDATSRMLNITPIDTQITGININFNIAGISGNPELLQSVELDQNYPNPFNPSTTIQFKLPHFTYITLKIFNCLGQEIETVANGLYNEGNYLVNWNAKNLASGIYIYVLKYQGAEYSKKMLLIK